MPLKRFLIPAIGALVLAAAYFAFRAHGQWPARGDLPTPSIVNAAKPPPMAGRQQAGAFASMFLPASGTPLRLSFPQLQARADAGDLAAATRLYRDLSICNRLRGIDWAISGHAKEVLDEQVGGMKPDQLEEYRAQLDAVESNKRNMQRLHNLCDGASNAMLESLVPNLQKAARLGEEHARACYLSRGPNYDASGFVNHPEWLAAYRGSVPSMIESGMEAGDWKVVDLLRNAYQPGAEDLLTGVLGTDPYQYYRYLKLYRLGAEPHLVEKLNKQMAAAAAQLAPAQVADADAWAERTFRQNFNIGNSTESTVAGWDPCGFPL
jgi:hypothetical protein